MTKWRVLKVMAVAAVVCGVGATLFGQVARTPADTSSDALVTELRALRADISQIARTSIRTQLLVARLQLQEQRLLTIGRQLLDVENLLTNARQELAGEQSKVRQLEEAASQSPDEGERRGLRQVLSEVKAQMGQTQRREQELRAQQTELVSAVNDEQGRWVDFNGRLDELERSLAIP
jgi:exonuclease VII large subunit